MKGIIIRRIISWFIDRLIIFALFVTSTYLFFGLITGSRHLAFSITLFTGGGFQYFPKESTEAFYILFTFYHIIQFLYYIFCEIYFKRTFGKMCLRLKYEYIDDNKKVISIKSVYFILKNIIYNFLFVIVYFVLFISLDFLETPLIYSVITTLILNITLFFNKGEATESDYISMLHVVKNEKKNIDFLNDFKSISYKDALLKINKPIKFYIFFLLTLFIIINLSSTIYHKYRYNNDIETWTKINTDKNKYNFNIELQKYLEDSSEFNNKYILYDSLLTKYKIEKEVYDLKNRQAQLEHINYYSKYRKQFVNRFKQWYYNAKYNYIISPQNFANDFNLDLESFEKSLKSNNTESLYQVLDYNIYKESLYDNSMMTSIYLVSYGMPKFYSTPVFNSSNLLWEPQEPIKPVFPTKPTLKVCPPYPYSFDEQFKITNSEFNMKIFEFYNFLIFISYIIIPILFALLILYSFLKFINSKKKIYLLLFSIVPSFLLLIFLIRLDLSNLISKNTTFTPNNTLIYFVLIVLFLLPLVTYLDKFLTKKNIYISNNIINKIFIVVMFFLSTFKEIKNIVTNNFFVRNDFENILQFKEYKKIERFYYDNYVDVFSNYNISGIWVFVFMCILYFVLSWIINQNVTNKIQKEED